MSRTPLLHTFQQLFQDFAEQEATGRPVAEIQAERNQRPSRRDFLELSSLGAVGVLASERWSWAAAAPRIAIVGGGISGLNAALTLQDAGLASTVYEASSRFGGRMHSDTTSWLNGQVTEHYGELIDSTHKTILRLAKRFGIAVDDVSGAEPARTADTYYFFGRYYTRDQANADFNAVYNAVKKDLKAAGYPTHYDSYTAAGYQLDQLSVHDWIETRVPGGHSSPMGTLLDLAYNIEYRWRNDGPEFLEPDLPAGLPADSGKLQDLRTLGRAVSPARGQRAGAEGGGSRVAAFKPAHRHGAHIDCEERRRHPQARLP